MITPHDNQPSHLQDMLDSGVNQARLIARARGKSPQAQRAFARLMQPHKGWILRRCRQRLGNYHDAQDCLQEVILRAYRGLENFRGDAELSTWLFRITENQCHSLGARRARHILSEHLENMILIHEEMGHGHNQMQLRELTAAITVVLEDMPKKSQQILRLRFFQDYSFGEIAQALQISLSAAKMRLYRALEDFRKRYLRLCDRDGTSAIESMPGAFV